VSLEEILSSKEILLTKEQQEKLNIYAKLLLEWSKVHNLTGAKSIEEIYINILDSIYPTKFLSPPKNFLDIGTGAGFPGLVLGVVWKNARGLLLEPRNKRAAFLKFVKLELELENLEVLKNRVENIRNYQFDLITSRAVTKVEDLLKLSKHLSKKDSKYLLFKGQNLEEEIKNLKLDYKIFKREKRVYLLIEKVKGEN
jgi:16S rRNA (guanine527-N7)-methyltransferase